MADFFFFPFSHRHAPNSGRNCKKQPGLGRGAPFPSSGWALVEHHDRPTRPAPPRRGRWSGGGEPLFLSFCIVSAEGTTWPHAVAPIVPTFGNKRIDERSPSSTQPPQPVPKRVWPRLWPAASSRGLGRGGPAGSHRCLRGKLHRARSCEQPHPCSLTVPCPGFSPRRSRLLAPFDRSEGENGSFRPWSPKKLNKYK